MLNFIAKQIHEVILKANNILLIPHQNPDGDALGSSTAFGVWLGHIEKDFTIFCKTPHTPRFSYLPLEKFTTDPAIWEKSFDVVIVFDSGDLRYAGVSEEIARVRDRIVLIDIDHHATNEFFGDLNFVDTKASSTSEMVQRFFLSIILASKKKLPMDCSLVLLQTPTILPMLRLRHLPSLPSVNCCVVVDEWIQFRIVSTKIFRFRPSKYGEK